jgi:hypothetical protein
MSYLFVGLFMCILFNEAINNVDCIMSNGEMMVSNEFEIIFKETIVVCPYCPSICLEGLREMVKCARILRITGVLDSVHCLEF